MGRNLNPFLLQVVSFRGQCWVPFCSRCLLMTYPPLCQVLHSCLQIISSEDHATLQNDLSLLHKWSVRWQLKFNISKRKHIHFEPAYHFGSYHLNGIKIDSVESHKDLGILFDHQLKFHLHTTDVVAKANRLLGLIRRSFDHLDSDMLIKLFVTVVRPTLEYCNSVWGPSFVLDQKKIEKIQHRATRLLLPIRDKPYGERLLVLQLSSLAYTTDVLGRHDFTI